MERLCVECNSRPRRKSIAKYCDECKSVKNAINKAKHRVKRNRGKMQTIPVVSQTDNVIYIENDSRLIEIEVKRELEKMAIKKMEKLDQEK
jgi:hypothetical protein